MSCIMIHNFHWLKPGIKLPIVLLLSHHLTPLFGSLQILMCRWERLFYCFLVIFSKRICLCTSSLVLIVVFLTRINLCQDHCMQYQLWLLDFWFPLYTSVQLWKINISYILKKIRTLNVYDKQFKTLIILWL